MSKKKTRKRTAPRGSGYNSLLIILVSLALIAIPVYMLGRVVYESYMESGEPIIAERFEDDLPNKITEEQIASVKDRVGAMADVESVLANLQAGTLKVQVDLRDNVTAEEIQEIQVQVYNQIASVLPIQTYFTRTDMVKNYDLEISLYNNPETLDVYSIYLKNASMSEPRADLVSTPLNPTVTIDDEQLNFTQLLNQANQINDSFLVDVTVEQIEGMIEKLREAVMIESDEQADLQFYLTELEAKLQRKLAQ